MSQTDGDREKERQRKQKVEHGDSEIIKLSFSDLKDHIRGLYVSGNKLQIANSALKAYCKFLD